MIGGRGVPIASPGGGGEPGFIIITPVIIFKGASDLYVAITESIH